MRAWIALMVLLSALSGCAASDPGPSVDSNLPGVSVKPTEDTGIIVGVVVDDAVRPVKGAKVQVLVPEGKPLEADTGADGTFGFAGLAPGSYFVKASKLGHFPAQQSVDVHAGLEDPPAVRLLLEVDADSMPYFQTYKWEGFMECGLTVIALCGVAEGVTNDEFITYHDVEKAPEWVQSEMVWESTQMAGSGFSLWHNVGQDGSFNGTNGHYEYGQSPLMIASDKEKVDELDLGTRNDQIVLRVFTGGIEGTAPGGECVELVLAICGVGATVNQEFTVFSHIFYGFQPPEGWRFTEHGEPQVPA